MKSHQRAVIRKSNTSQFLRHYQHTVFNTLRACLQNVIMDRVVDLWNKLVGLFQPRQPA